MMLSGLVAEGLQDMLLQYLQLKLDFGVKDQVRPTWDQVRPPGEQVRPPKCAPPRDQVRPTWDQVRPLGSRIRCPPGSRIRWPPPGRAHPSPRPRHAVVLNLAPWPCAPWLLPKTAGCLLLSS